jgi:hypothetical protein
VGGRGWSSVQRQHYLVQLTQYLPMEHTVSTRTHSRYRSQCKSESETHQFNSTQLNQSLSSSFALLSQCPISACVLPLPSVQTVPAERSAITLGKKNIRKLSKSTRISCSCHGHSPRFSEDEVMTSVVVQDLCRPCHARGKGIHPFKSLDNPTPRPDNTSAWRYAIRL